MSFPSIWNRETGGNCDIVIGIDFGTTNSCVSVWRPDKKYAKIIKDKSKLNGKRTTPSTILFEDGFNNCQIGKQLSVTDSDNLVSNIKPCLGAEANTASNEIVGLKTVFDIANDKLMITCLDGNDDTCQFTPEELVSHILKYLKECAEDYLTRKPFKNEDGTVDSNKKLKKVVINKAVIGIPVNYTERKKDAIRAAANMAGFEEVHLMIESTAAAMAYGLLVAGTKNVLTVDIGGGTTDLTIMNISDGVHTVEGSGGHVKLGGVNMDLRLYELVCRKITDAVQQLRIAQYLYFDEKGLTTQLVKIKGQLLQLCKDCKEELTENDSHVISIPLTLLGVNNNKSTNSTSTSNTNNNNSKKKSKTEQQNIEIAVSRTEFDMCIKPLTDLLTGIIVHTMQSWIDKKQLTSDCFDISNCLDEIVLVGGASRVPAVHTAIRSACTVLGIHRFAPRDANGQGGGFELCTAVNPDEVVAEGLAIRGAILSGAHSTSTMHNILMMDCMAMSIGLMSWTADVDTASSTEHKNTVTSKNKNKNKPDDKSRVFDVIIRKGDKIPAKGSKKFKLASSTQRLVSLDMYERIEEQSLVSSTATSVQDNDQQSSPAPPQTITTYSYHLIATADMPVPPLRISTHGSESANDVRMIEVIFRMDEQGLLQFEVLDCDTDTDADTSTTLCSDTTAGGGGLKHRVIKDDQHSDAAMRYLTMYIILMIMLYLAVKVLLVEVEVKSDKNVSSQTGIVERILDTVIEKMENTEL